MPAYPSIDFRCRGLVVSLQTFPNSSIFDITNQLMRPDSEQTFCLRPVPRSLSLTSSLAILGCGTGRLIDLYIDMVPPVKCTRDFHPKVSMV